MALTPRQQRFVDEYVVDLNATQAAIRAGYSPRTANMQGNRLMAKDSIKARVNERRASIARSLEITQERIAREYARIAFADMRQFARVDGGGIVLTDSDEWSDDDAAAVAELSETRTENGGSIRFKLHSKVAALDSLAKMLGMFPKETKIEFNDNRVQNLTLAGLTIEEMKALAMAARNGHDS